jgi:hypothetical protein
MANNNKEQIKEKEDIEVLSEKQGQDQEREASSELKEAKEQLDQEDVKRAREEIEKSDIDDSLKLQAASQAQNMKTLDEEKKIKKLVELVQSKGVVYAVAVARKMGDPFILDSLHDFLAKEGYYKQFLK